MSPKKCQQGRESPLKRQRELRYDPQSEVVRAEHWPRVTALSAPTLWRLRQRGDFPAVIKLGDRAVGAFRRDIVSWLEGRQAK